MNAPYKIRMTAIHWTEAYIDLKKRTELKPLATRRPVLVRARNNATCVTPSPTRH